MGLHNFLGSLWINTEFSRRTVWKAALLVILMQKSARERLEFPVHFTGFFGRLITRVSVFRRRSKRSSTFLSTFEG